MIYLIYGNDFTKKSEQIKKLANGASIVRVPADQLTEGGLLSLARQSPLFGEAPATVIEDLLDQEFVISEEVLDSIKNSSNVFIILENSATQTNIKKYKKYIEEVFVFEEKLPPRPKGNAFLVAEMYAKRNRIGAWTAYVELVESGEVPEAISGMLFWKIKTMVASRAYGTYTQAELLERSSKLLDIYHRAHLGEIDMGVELEQFIISTI